MMAIRRYDARRDSNEAQIVAAFEGMGCQVERIDTPCDLLVNIRGAVFLVEVKTERGTLTKPQQSFSRTWPVHVVRSVDDAIALVKSKRAA